MTCRKWTMLFATFSLVACTTTPERARALAQQCETDNKPETSFLGLYKPEGAEFAYQDYAEQAYLYAQLADNAYPRRDQWILPAAYREVAAIDDATGTGFAARVFEDGPPGAPNRVIIAYRGTEGPFLVSRDWWNGNFLTRQQRQAERFYETWRAKYPASVPFVVTGHSLGGALALQISITNAGVPAYVFNSSYRVARRMPEAKSYRLSISETGEIVKVVRGVLPNVTILHLSGFDCTTGSPIRNHGMTALARCLTRVAAARDPSAIASLSMNKVDCAASTTP